MQQQSRVALSLPEDVKRSPTCTACGPGIHPLQGMKQAGKQAMLADAGSFETL